MRRYSPLPFRSHPINGFLAGRRVVTAAFLSGGRRNSNYRVELNDGLKCVVRFHAGDPNSSESSVLSAAAGAAPVPEVLAEGDGWLAMSWLPGRALTESARATSAAAAALAGICAVRFERPGWIGPGGAVEPFSFHGIEGFLAMKLGGRVLGRRLGRDRVGRIAAILRRQRRRLREMDKESSLVHGDFNPTNILIEDGEVSGIVDWEFAHSGTAWADVGNLLRHTPQELQLHIARGLQSGGMEIPDDWKRRARLADLSAHLQFVDEEATPDDLVVRSLRWLERFEIELG